MAKKRSSEYFVGKQYHIACGPGDLAPVILLVGDPARAKKIARRFSKITFRARHREYVTYTGIFRGARISVMSTGIGTDNTDIAVQEIAQCVNRAILIRVGSCGAIQPGVRVGDVAISADALGLENTSGFYCGSVKKPKSDSRVLVALVRAARDCGVTCFVGTTASTSSFYGGQGRETPYFPIKDRKIVTRLSRRGVLNFEMETSALFNLANYVCRPKGKLRAGSVCAVYANRIERQGFNSDIKTAEQNAINVGLTAAKLLSRPRRRRFSFTCV